MQTESPVIYVACLAAYNNGILHGGYVEADKGTDHLYEGIKQILAKSPIPNAEEWAIHDYENFHSIQIDEYTCVETIAEIAEFIAEHGELGAEVYAWRGSFESAKEMLEDEYNGEWKSEEDFAYHLAEECGDLKSDNWLMRYVDFEAVARDLFMSDYHSIEVNGTVHVFRNC